MQTNLPWESPPQISVKPSKLSIVLLFSFFACILGIIYTTKSASANSQSELVMLNFPGCTMPGYGGIGSPPHEVVAVDIDFDGRYFIDGEEITLQGLQNRLNSLLRNKPFITINIQANRLATFGSFFKVLKFSQLAGANSVGIVHAYYYG